MTSSLPTLAATASRGRLSETYPVDFYQRDAEDMSALMTALGYERFTVLGWSDGANSGSIMAVRYPKRVKQLVVWGGNSYLNAEHLHIFQSMRSMGRCPGARPHLSACNPDLLQSR
jgi:pimeloyl-ACP methyl ester carboxylesterase